jgi:hypothetical protein
LPASLLGHTLLFHGEHEMGGAFHGMLVTLALAAGAGLFAAIFALACGGSRATDGSVLASRLADRLPGLAGILAAAILFFALGESLEPAHAAESIAATLAAMFAASWLVSAIARAAVRALASIIVAVARARFADRSPVPRTFAVRPIITKLAPLMRRMFARPPPTTIYARA